MNLFIIFVFKKLLEKHKYDRIVSGSFNFSLSEKLSRKENIVSWKNCDYEILTYLHGSRYSKFIYDVFTGMYACMCACTCVYLSEHDIF